MGAPQTRWTPYDLAQLRVIYRSLERGEVRKEEEFPAPAGTRVTATEIITGQTAPVANGHTATSKDAAPVASPVPAGGTAPPASAPPASSTDPGSATKAQVGKIESLYQNQLGFKRAEHGLTVGASEQIIGRDLTGPHDGHAHANLSEAEAVKLIDTLDGITDRDRLVEYLTAPAADAPGGAG
jgi:hypothetical protein